MLMPKRTKFRKYQVFRSRPTGFACKGVCSGFASEPLQFGNIAIQALQAGRLSARVIEATRRTITRKLKRKGQLWTRVFPDIPVTAKPAEVRMGKGKGPVSFWVARVKRGQILFEVDGVGGVVAYQAIQKAIQKLPLSARVLTRTNI